MYVSPVLCLTGQDVHLGVAWVCAGVRVSAERGRWVAGPAAAAAVGAAGVRNAVRMTGAGQAAAGSGAGWLTAGSSCLLDVLLCTYPTPQ